jgi:hypothetical protein
MLNALKNPFPDDPDADSREEVGENNFLKYKRPLLILFLLVLVVGAFSLFTKQNIEAKNIAKSLAVTSSAVKESTASSPPAVEKSVPADIPTPLFKDNIAKLTYKGDKEYLALNQFERFPEPAKTSVRTNRQKVRATVTRGDKPLTLAGRGFDFKGLQPQSRAAGDVGFVHRLQKPFAKMESNPKDHLDLQLTQAKSSKDLIFHPSSPAFGKYNRQKKYIKDEKPENRKPQVLQDIPETKLLFTEADNSLLILRPGRESLDLLGGNEKINRNEFNRW